MKLRLTTLFAIAITFFLASCAGLLGPREVELPVHKLQEAMSRKFPFNNRYLELFDISVSNPRIALQPETNRLMTTMDALIAPPFVNRSWKGTFTLSGNVRIDPARNAIVLTDARMDGFSVDGVDPAYTRQIAKVGSLLAEQLLKDAPLYTFKPEDFRYGGTSFLPARIITKPNALVVTFEPAR